jgi:hypothetical protein
MPERVLRYFAGSTYSYNHCQFSGSLEKLASHLHVAFCDIHRGHCGVSETTSKGPAEHGHAVVGRIVRNGTKESGTVG